MNENINSICVFASSSNDIDKIYFDYAKELGKTIAKNSYNIVYGGSTLGLMGETVKSAKLYGSKIIGIMPEKLHSYGIDSGDCDKFILTSGMRERKAKMDELSQAVIALPGGFGTIEELSEILTQKQLGYNNKPIVILNINNYYDNFINFLSDIIENKFALNNSYSLYFVANSPKQAVDYINNYKFEKINYLDEKLLRK